MGLCQFENTLLCVRDRKGRVRATAEERAGAGGYKRSYQCLAQVLGHAATCAGIAAAAASWHPLAVGPVEALEPSSPASGPGVSALSTT